MKDTIHGMFVALLVTLSPAIAEAPPLGWTTLAKVVRVIDGDTVDVVISKRVRIRLEDCWAPERRNPGGAESTAHLRMLVDGKDVTLHIPGDDDIRRLITFGRFVGRLYVDGQDVSRLQVEAGHATESR